MRDDRATGSHRTVLISDLHLGSYRCDAPSVLSFLERHRAETLYLVGDVVDLWSLRRRGAWRPAHVEVIRRLLELSREGTRVVVIPGNHDGPLLHLSGFGFGDIEVRRQAILGGADGGTYLIAHGHEQDRLFGTSSEIAGLFCGIGERIGEALTTLGLRRGASRGGAEAGAASRFERALIAAARDCGADGVICGHSHRPSDRRIDGLRYLNCGDWMGNCTAITESRDGRLELLRWGPSSQHGVSHEMDDWGREAPAFASLAP